MKQKKEGFLGMFLDTLGGLSGGGPLPTGKGTIRADEVTFRADEGTIGAVQYFEWCLVLQKILKLKSIIKINLGNYLTKKKDGAY